MASEKMATAMAPAPRRVAARRGRPGPEVVAPTNRINVALPFSHLEVEGTSEDLADLAQVVAELAAVVTDMAPTPKAEAVRARAEILTTRLT